MQRPMLKEIWWRWALLAVVVLGGLWLRIHDLSRVFLWLDETDMFNEYVYGGHHKSLVDFALYSRRATTITWGWPGIVWVVSRTFGSTIAAARMPTVFMSAAGVLALFGLVFYLLPRDLPGNRFWPAIFAASLAAVSITQLELSQRTFPYGAVPCMAAAILLAHFHLLRAAAPEWKYDARVGRAIVLYATVCSVTLCLHSSPALLIAVSVSFLGWSAARGLLRQPRNQRWKLMRLAICAGLIMAVAAVSNAKNPRYGYRPYIANYYGSLSAAAIPKTLAHAYDLATYHLNLFYNHALYWPESLNAFLLPLVALTVVGWGLAASGRFGRLARSFALLGTVAMAVPAMLSLVRIYPFGGVRQTLFLNPFLLSFAALGFYSLRGRWVTRLLGIALAAGYLVGWGANLPAFYRERHAAYSQQELVDTLKENGSLPIYAWGSERELRYELRGHPEIQIQTLPQESTPPYLLICTHNWVGDDYWFRGYAEFLRRTGFKARLVKENPSWNRDSLGHSGSLYFPPNGLWIYKVTAN